MNIWIIPNNPKDYDVHDGIAEYGDEIEWTKTLATTNIAVGDFGTACLATPCQRTVRYYASSEKTRS